MTAPKVTTDYGLRELAGPWLQTCGYCDAGLATACTCPDVDPRPLILALYAAVEKRTRIAASLEADLARILAAWDDGANYPRHGLRAFSDAIAAAREWVGIEVTTACLCCGRSVVNANPRQPLHFDCWNEHHSDPTEVWPPGHRCSLDEWVGTEARP